MNTRSISGTPSSPPGNRVRRSSWRRGAGFTLIELMIVVAIVAILAAVAYPAYTNSIMKGKRAQGRTALLELITQQERYFTQGNSYLSFGAVSTPTATDAGSNTVSPFPFKNYSGDNSSAAAYLLGSRTCNAAAITTLNSCVEVFAMPQFADPVITVLTIRSTGLKDCSVVSGSKSVCWN